MLQIQNDRTSLLSGGDQSAPGPMVGMSNASDVRSTLGHRPGAGMPDDSSNGHLTFDNPFDVPQHAIGDGKSGTGGVESSAVPSGVVGERAWGVVMAENSKTVDASAQASVADPSVYYHLKTGGWVQALAPSQMGTGSSDRWEGNWNDNYQGNIASNQTGKLMPDGSYQFSALPTGKLDHFGREKIPFPLIPISTTVSMKL